MIRKKLLPVTPVWCQVALKGNLIGYSNNMKKKTTYLKLVLIVIVLMANKYASAQNVLTTNKLKNYVAYFNSIDSEYAVNYIPNAKAYDWLSKNIPLFECPDTTIEKIYYYRWWTVRKHLKETPDGFVFTEFITPMNHAGKYNTISSALGHHIYELRWLHNQQY